jgi:hypothetical protein
MWSWKSLHKYTKEQWARTSGWPLQPRPGQNLAINTDIMKRTNFSLECKMLWTRCHAIVLWHYELERHAWLSFPFHSICMVNIYNLLLKKKYHHCVQDIYHNTFLHSCETPLYQSYGGQLDLILNSQTSCWTSWTFLSMDDSILLLWLILVISNIIFTWSWYQYYGTPPIYSQLRVHHYVFFCSQESLSTLINS